MFLFTSIFIVKCFKLILNNFSYCFKSSNRRLSAMRVKRMWAKKDKCVGKSVESRTSEFYLFYDGQSEVVE